MQKKKEKNTESNMGYVIIVFVIIEFILLIMGMDEFEAGDSGTGIYGYIYVNIFCTVISMLSILCVRIKYKTSLRVVKKYDYYRDTNFKYINAVASGILTKKVKIDVNTIITAIYELATKNVVEITWKEQKNFIKLLEHDKEKIKTLLPYERSIIYFIFKGPDDAIEYALEDVFKDISKDATKNYALKAIEKDIASYISTFYSKFETYAESHHMNWAKITVIPPIIIFVLGIPLFIVSLFVVFRFPYNLLFIEYIVNFIVMICYLKIRFLKFEYQDEVQKLNGLYTYLSDISELNRQELKFYQLYNSYYLYAMGLGLADKFEKELEQDKLNNEVRVALQFYLQNRRDI